VSCAREVQAILHDEPELKVRIGIHLGDVVFANNTVLGGVNVASRIHALAPPGGICVSANVYDEIRHKPGTRVKDLGEQRLKNVSRPIRVYQIVATDLIAESKVPNAHRFRTVLIAGAGAVILAGLAVVSSDRDCQPRSYLRLKAPRGTPSARSRSCRSTISRAIRTRIILPMA